MRSPCAQPASGAAPEHLRAWSPPRGALLLAAWLGACASGGAGAEKAGADDEDAGSEGGGGGGNGGGGGDGEAEDTGPIDLTVEVPEPPPGGYSFVSPIIEVGPYQEVQYCYYGTYFGPDLGVTSMVGQTSAGITHHTAVMGVYDTTFPDGTLRVCDDQGEGLMPIYGPLFDPIGIDVEGGEPMPIDPFDGLDWLSPPPGVAMPLRTGQRWALDLHYINTSDRPALVNTAFEVQGVDPSEVESWAGTALFDSAPLDLPPGDSSITFDCRFETEWDILTMMAHMHYFGRAFKSDLIRVDGRVETLFEVEEWTPAHKEYPKISAFDIGEAHVTPGDILRTTCSWSNPTDEVLPDPVEMCSMNMVTTPNERPVVCIAGVYRD
ncbi:MAG: hypothetical protein RL071_782 [Pseudomonadota bacterium]|jgi:hypothetical protein